MKTLQRLVFTVCLIAFIAVIRVAAQTQNDTQILRVERIPQMAPPAKVGLEKRKIAIPLSRSDYTRLSVTGETYRVYWDAGDGVPAETMVTFEYRVKGSQQTKFLYEKYGDPIRGEWTTTFQIPSGELAVAWRARIVYGGRRLAETTSDTWR